jgi:hypothetical protein
METCLILIAKQQQCSDGTCHNMYLLVEGQQNAMAFAV